MLRPPERLIGILRPAHAALGAQIESIIDDQLYGKTADEDPGHVSDVIDSMREMMTDLSESLDLRPIIVDCQIHNHSETALMSTNRRKRIGTPDVLAFCDPEPRTLAWGIRSVQENALQTIIVASTTEERRMYIRRLLEKISVPLLMPNKKEWKGSHKSFPLSVQTSAGNFTGSDIMMMRQALTFPVRPEVSDYNDTPAIILQNVIPRKFLVEPTTDRDRRLKEEFLGEPLSDDEVSAA